LYLAVPVAYALQCTVVVGVPREFSLHVLCSSQHHDALGRRSTIRPVLGAHCVHFIELLQLQCLVFVMGGQEVLLRRQAHPLVGWSSVRLRLVGCTLRGCTDTKATHARLSNACQQRFVCV
jgi:hypothetical protein